MRLVAPLLSFVLFACGGSETPSPEPVMADPAPAPAPAPAPDPAPAAAADAAPSGGDSELAAMTDEEKVAHLMSLGEQVYTTGGSGGVACVTCHQAGGTGVPGAFPPLVGQGEFFGDCTQHAGFVVHGLSGAITIDGTPYNGAMPAQGALSDLEIAAVITYVRSTWGNDYGHCLPEHVAAARANAPD